MVIGSSTRQPVRRARGLARIALILEAAAAEFADVGYSKATTNSIAARAGISPGSLYQYFSDKAAIADALGSQYAEMIAKKQESAFEVTNPLEWSLDELLAAVVDPIIDFNIETPGFLALFARTDLPERLSSPIDPVESAFASRIRDLLQARNPQVESEEVWVLVETAILMFRGLMNGISELNPTAQRRRAHETREAILAYLTHRGLV